MPSAKSQYWKSTGEPGASVPLPVVPRTRYAATQSSARHSEGSDQSTCIWKGMSDVPDGKSLRITSSRSTVWMWCSKFWTPRSVDADTFAALALLRSSPNTSSSRANHAAI